MNYIHSNTRELKEIQKVNFIIDNSESFSGFEQLEIIQYPKIFLFIDRIIYEKYRNFVSLLNSIHGNIIITKIDSDESEKNISRYSNYIEILSNGACSKKDLILAVGGGVILDVVGFLSSTYMRGVDFIAVPTTLVGQSDASTAGKTCINTNASKNLIGTFYLPKVVYNNTHFLKTSTDYSLRQGFSEIFKYGLLSSQKLIDLLVEGEGSLYNSQMNEILRIVMNARFDIRTRNPLASNLGHTFGHALEKYSEYEVGHGDAISAGIIMALKFSLDQGLISESIFTKVGSWMDEIGLNTYIEADINPIELASLMCKDKKSFDDTIGLVLVKEVAEPLTSNEQPFYYADRKQIENFLIKYMNNENHVKKGCWKQLMENGN